MLEIFTFCRYAIGGFIKKPESERKLFELYILITKLLSAYQYIIFIWVALGWLQMYNVLPNSRPLYVVMDILYRLTDPVLGAIRRILPPFSGIDFSPLVALLGIQVLKIILRNILL